MIVEFVNERDSSKFNADAIVLLAKIGEAQNWAVETRGRAGITLDMPDDMGVKAQWDGLQALEGVLARRDVRADLDVEYQEGDKLRYIMR